MADPRRIEQAVKRVRNQKAFIQDLLIDALGWDIEERAEDVEEISFEWSAEELRADGLDKHIVDGTIRQIRPFKGNPWGIFILEFKNPDVFATGRGMTGTLRRVLRGLVPSKKKRSSLASFGRENLLFICNHDYQHYRFAHFKTPSNDGQTAPLAAFGWGPGDPIRTLCEYNLNALEWPDSQPDAEGWIAAWSQAFDVEKVTKRFYEDYAAVFEKVEKLIAKQKEIKGDDLRMFTQTLFNRLMFLRFMERKRWLAFGSHTDYLRALYAAGGYGKKSFYKGRLCPLFFDGLAVEGKQESEAYGCVPYLNGGLFERTELDKQVTDLPDEVFTGILADEHAGGLFYRYNFTVEESTPLDIEVAVDPEMLGKVFEELVTGRHDTGSYYTPRPVVSFMCREALKGYLSDKTKASAGAVAALVDRQEVSRLKETHAREILAALDDLKAVDPACGSGAYLLGLLQEMIVLYRLLYSERLIKDARTLYDLKLRIISQSLYGVDIDPFATNIAKLRLWLSLAVEADVPVPLPNLDFKIETGDSLLAPNPQEMPDLFRGLLQASADVLAMVKKQYFLAHGQEKDEYRETITKGEARLRESVHEELGTGVVDWRIQFAEVFAHGHKGFDILVANPPYGAVLDDVAPLIHRLYPDSTQKHKDSYKNFIDLSLRLLRPNGVFGLITPNTFIRQPRYEDVRKLLAKTTPLVLLNLGEDVFENCVVPVAISIGVKAAQKCTQVLCGDISDKGGDYWREYGMAGVSFTEVPLSRVFEDCRRGLYLTCGSGAPTHLREAKEFFVVKDAGINYQRTNVGMRVKGNSDLSERLLYEGKRESPEHKMYWKGADIDRFYMEPKTERWCRPNFREFIRSNEVVRLNSKVYSTVPKILFRQTADRIIACLDEKGVWFGRSIIAALPMQFLNRSQLLFLLAALNSGPVTRAYQADSGEGGRVFAQVKKSRFEVLMLPDPRTLPNATVEQVAAQVERLTARLRETGNDVTEKCAQKLFASLEEMLAPLF